MVNVDTSVLANRDSVTGVVLGSKLDVTNLMVMVLSAIAAAFLSTCSTKVSDRSVFSGLGKGCITITMAVMNMVTTVICPVSSVASFLCLVNSMFTPVVTVRVTSFFVLGESETSGTISVYGVVM